MAGSRKMHDSAPEYAGRRLVRECEPSLVRKARPTCDVDNKATTIARNNSYDITIAQENAIRFLRQTIGIMIRSRHELTRASILASGPSNRLSALR